MDITAVSLWVGMSVHAANWDAPEIRDLDNPIGVVQLERRLNKDSKVYCRHESSIPRSEDGYGYNSCGVMLRVK